MTGEKMGEVLDKAASVRLVIFDVDGVLTDGRLYFGQHGDKLKAFHSRDGHGMKMLQDAGIAIAILSGRRSTAVERRMADLRIQHVHLGTEDKRRVFEELRSRLGLEPGQIAYVGDDLIDLPVMTRVGLAVAVEDADPFVKRHADWITPSPGGRGAARDVCELVLEAQGLLEALRGGYL
jgi:3-deoxy-D-manno-octulosonate 8-phosphate phosphatase (KDO 8-P phosphatase)